MEKVYYCKLFLKKIDRFFIYIVYQKYVIIEIYFNYNHFNNQQASTPWTNPFRKKTM